MNADKLFTLLGSIVVLAVVASVLSSKNTVGIIGGLSSGFTNSLKAAKGA